MPPTTLLVLPKRYSVYPPSAILELLLQLSEILQRHLCLHLILHPIMRSEAHILRAREPAPLALQFLVDLSCRLGDNLYSYTMFHAERLPSSDGELVCAESSDICFDGTEL